MIVRNVRLAAFLGAFASLAACASPAPAPASLDVAGASPAPCCAVLRIEVEAIPAFNGDGTVARDAATGAPVYRCRSVPTSEPCPRWNADGTVARDSATGAPVFEERAEGKVVRVLIVLP